MLQFLFLVIMTHMVGAQQSRRHVNPGTCEATLYVLGSFGNGRNFPSGDFVLPESGSTYVIATNTAKQMKVGIDTCATIYDSDDFGISGGWSASYDTGAYTFPAGGGVPQETSSIRVQCGTCASQVSTPVICIEGETRLDVPGTPGAWKAAKDLHAGDFLLDWDGNAIEIIHQVISGSTTDFVVFEKDSMGPDKPSHQVMVTDTHNVLDAAGYEVQAIKLAGTRAGIYSTRLDEAREVFNFVTAGRDLFQMSGMTTVSWSLDEYTPKFGTKYTLA